MPPARFYGPTRTETFTSGKQSRRKASDLKIAAEGEPLAKNRLYFLNRDLKEIDRRAKQNKRGLSPKMAERRARTVEQIRNLEKGAANAQREAAARAKRNKAANEKAKAKRAAAAAAKAGNPVKAAKKTAPKKAAKKKAS